MLLDSYIIIYAARPEHEALRCFIARHAPKVSAVSVVETLGYHRLNESEKQFLEEFFDAAEVLPITEHVIDEAVRLRQLRRMTLGDSLIAATAVVHTLTLLTHNTEDFAGIEDLTILDPLTQPL